MQAFSPSGAARAPQRFHPLMIGMHWLTLALLLAVYVLIEFRGAFPKGSLGRDTMKLWHEMLGLTVLGLVFVRLALRAVLPAPEPLVAPRWQQRFARLMHVALYVFLIATPILGWLMLSAKGKAVPWFGFDLPSLVGPDRALGRRFESMHEAIATLGYLLIGVHAAAAIGHHYLLRDDTLRRMLPWRRLDAPSKAPLVTENGHEPA